MNRKFTQEYTVQSSDIDELNHVNNIKYLEWMQEISKEHWYVQTKGMSVADDFFWVVANHFIEYRASALINDELIIETFIEHFEKAYSFRRVNVRLKKNGKLIMTALTKWCLMNAETKRISRVTPEMAELFINL